MIEGRTVSVLITTYRRYETLDKVISAWLAQAVEQVWVLDGGGKFRSRLAPGRLQVFNLPVDTGTKTDYAFALLIDGDLIFLADDDVLVKPGFAEDMVKCWQQWGGIVGIIGRTFHGPIYWGNTRFYRSSNLAKPQRVGFAGVIYLAGREFFGFDVRGCPRNCDDLWWQMKVFPGALKHVAPTKAYSNLPTASDRDAMYHTVALKAQREAFYREHYLKTYAPTGRIW